MSDTDRIDEENASLHDATSPPNNDVVVEGAPGSASSPSDNNNDGLDIEALEGGKETNDPTELKEIIYGNTTYVGPDLDLEGWFHRHALPYTDLVKISLDDWGVQCVEQLKLLPSDTFLGMYEPEKFVVRETAVSQTNSHQFFCTLLLIHILFIVILLTS
jgi:hypothetical protein